MESNASNTATVPAPPRNEIVVYQPDETIRLDVRLEEDTVWLTQGQMTDLFQRDRTVITRHIGNVFSEGELDEKSNVHFLHIPFSDMIIDDKELYLIGASLKDLGKKCFAFTKLDAAEIAGIKARV